MTWSGSFTNEKFVAPGTFDLHNGLRGLLDMAAGDATINTPLDPDVHSSCILAWDNPHRNLLTLNSVEGFEDWSPPVNVVVFSITTRLQRGVLAFSFFEGVWQITSWSSMGVSQGITFSVRWEPTATNGLATIIDSIEVVEVERTGLGLYTVRLSPSAAIGVKTIVRQQTNVIGLPTDNEGRIQLLDIGHTIDTEILTQVGRRDKNGKWWDDDLVYGSSPALMLSGELIP